MAKRRPPGIDDESAPAFAALEYDDLRPGAGNQAGGRPPGIVHPGEPGARPFGGELSVAGVRARARRVVFDALGRQVARAQLGVMVESAGSQDHTAPGVHLQAAVVAADDDAGYLPIVHDQ